MRRYLTTTGFLTAALALTTGCPTRAVSNLSPHEEKENVKEIPVSVNRNIDILFVIDNSGSMSQEQTSLTTNFPRFIEVLNQIEGGLPNVHIGVVSSDVGIGGYSAGGCSGDGDNGRLQNAARAGACQPPQGYFIVDVIDPTIVNDPGTPEDESHITNYTGTLAETFSCIAQLGTSGCGLEQHLESMKRALDGRNSENSQFIRKDDPATAANDEAYLAVILIADEDDCSAEDSSVFDPSQQDVSDPLGPFGSFRCFEFGVQCGGIPVSRSPAEYEDCEPIPESDTNYLHHPKFYADFVKGLKRDPSNIMVAGIVGDPTPVRVIANTGGEPALDWSCNSPNGEASPGIRLKAFLDEFPNRNTLTSICDPTGDLSGALEVIANLLKRIIGTPCLDGDVDPTDIDPAMPGLQLQCQVADVLNLNADDEDSTTLPRCKLLDGPTGPIPDPSNALPCWWTSLDPAACADTQTGILLNIERVGDAPIGTTVVARCVGAQQ